LFKEALGNPGTIFVYDMDGVLADSPKIVLQNFTEKNGIKVNPAEIDEYAYLTKILKQNGFSRKQIKHAEDDWFDPKVLHKAQRYLYIKPVVEKTIAAYGAKNNYVLTVRDPDFTDSSLDWLTHQFPKFLPENLMIRTNKKMDGTYFKVGCLTILAQTAPWVVYIDDSTDFTKAAVMAGIENCIAVNVPIGKTMPDFRHERLIIIKRYPNELQAMYPFMYAVDRALENI